MINNRFFKAALSLIVITMPLIANADTQDGQEKLINQANSDKLQIRELTQKWLEGWDIGDQPFNGEVFRPLFAAGENGILVFDNVQGDVIVLTSVDDYVSTWVPFMEPLSNWSVKLEDLDVDVSGKLAITTFKLVGTDTRGPDGKPIPFGQYGTHVWKKSPEHGWRIVHEHLTSYDAANDNN